MSGRLIRDEVELLATRDELRHDVCRVPEQPDRKRSPLGSRGPHPLERVVQRVRGLVEVARLEPPLDPVRIDLHAEDRGAGHRPGERLRAAHAAEPGREDRAAAQSGEPKCFSPAAANVWYVPWRIPCVPM